jgi:hypothetical protein
MLGIGGRVGGIDLGGAVAGEQCGQRLVDEFCVGDRTA